MKAIPMEVGRLVRSLAGRDAGRLFVVTQVLDAEFVLVCDGGLRTLARPKKKRVKHLRALCARMEAFSAGTGIEDHQLRRWIREEEGKLVQV